ncbi:MAG: AsmA family protein [Betaproteobacteria bacterium]|nr:AsmA family protein [Betaproteobacteria bacterium]
MGRCLTRLTRPLAMKALKYALLVTGALALAAAAFVAYLVITFDARDYEPRIAEMVKAKTGRTLQVKGETRLSFWPDLGVRLGPVILTERDSNEAFADVEDARFTVKLRPLLAKELVADELMLRGAHVRITRFADGHLNIDDLFENDSGPLEFDIGRVAIERSTVSYRDLGAGTSHELADIHLTTGRLFNGTPTPVKLSTRATDGARTYDVRSSIEGRLTFDLGRRRYTLDEATIELKGRTGPVADLAAVFKGGLVMDDGELRARPLSITAGGSFGSEKLDARVDAAALSLGGAQSIGETVTAKITSNGAHGTSTVVMTLPRTEWRDGAFTADAVALEADLRRAAYTIRATAHGALKADTAAGVLTLAQLESTFTGSGSRLPKQGVKGTLAGNVSVELAAQRVHATLDGRVSDSNVKATLAAVGFATPVFTFAAEIDALDTDRYAGSGKSSSNAGGLDLASLSTLPATGTLRIGALKTAGVTARNVRLVVTP